MPWKQSVTSKACSIEQNFLIYGIAIYNFVGLQVELTLVIPAHESKNTHSPQLALQLPWGLAPLIALAEL